MNPHYLAPLFDPKSLLVYLPAAGVSSIADLLRASLAESAFSGEMTWLELADGFPALTGTPRASLALIAVPGTGAVQALEHAAAARVRTAILYEPDETHIAELAAVATKHGIHLLGPGSSGLQRPHLKLNACIAGTLQRAGSLALVSQSGALTAAMLDWAESNGVRFSAVVATGRSAVLDLADILDFLAQDGRTQSIIVYMEGIRSARRFMSALRAASRAKPVIVLKAGRRDRGRHAALTHSGTMVGGDDVFDAALKRAGAVRVDSFVQLFSAAKCLAGRYRPTGNRLGVIGNGGGPGVLAADHAFLRGIDIPSLSIATVAQMRTKLPLAPSLENPVDIGEHATAEDFVAAVETLAASPDVDGVLVVMTPKPGIDTEAIARAATAALPAVRKPLIGCWMGETRLRETRLRVSEAGLPVFRLPEAAVDAFANIAAFYRNQQNLMQTPPPLNVGGAEDAPDVARARALFDAVLAAGREVLTETESKELLSAFRIPVTPTEVAKSADEAVAIAQRFGFPVVIKVSSRDIAHKSDVGGVMLNVRTPQQVRTVFTDMTEEAARRAPDAKIEGVSVQPMVVKRHGRELYVGMATDELFGPVISFGAGGTLIEVIDDRTVALPPINLFLARRMIERARSAAVLSEWRGMPKIQIEALEYLLLRVSEMICEIPQLRELDINPVIIDEFGAAVVDARAVVRKVTSDTPYAHLAILPYPNKLAREFATRSGVHCELRAIRPEDADALQRFVRELSEESRYFRFLSTMAELSPTMLARFTQVDYDREMAIVAVVPEAHGHERIIGVARYLLNPDAVTAEFALAVADEFQGQGIGSALMKRIATIARDRGLKAVIGLVLGNNRDMLGLMQSLGFVEEVDPDDAELRRVVMQL
ncbi:MAG: bifunctional acetate--CoA ligase family protein/GNAT family N-acetyltransferase [Burkholderiales bacterium]|nr:bifunctional acetate--CoA ligase family protein/GNAT family N-acetyltransferase [Burkholderiales bacterium]